MKSVHEHVKLLIRKLITNESEERNRELILRLFFYHFKFIISFFFLLYEKKLFKDCFIQVYVHKSLSYFLRQFLHYADKYKQTFLAFSTIQQVGKHT